MKSIKSICSNCKQCCKQYNITLLPKEAEKIRKKLNLTEKTFVQQYCDLSLQFFPSFESENYFVINKELISEKIKKKLIKKSNAEYFFVLPSISLKKTSYCVFLKNGLCEIHEVKPEQCSLFPFISLKKQTNFKESYSFCELLIQGFKPEKEFKEKSKQHYENIKNCFNKIKEKGFNSVWKILPEKGNVFFEDKKISEITKKDFLDLIEF